MEIPAAVRFCLWSYNVDAMDIERDRGRIITNVLNYGTKPATDWLFKIYPMEDIREMVKHPLPGEWDKKSLNLWSLLFGVTPQLRGRFSDQYALRHIG